MIHLKKLMLKKGCVGLGFFLAALKGVPCDGKAFRIENPEKSSPYKVTFMGAACGGLGEKFLLEASRSEPKKVAGAVQEGESETGCYALSLTFPPGVVEARLLNGQTTTRQGCFFKLEKIPADQNLPTIGEVKIRPLRPQTVPDGEEIFEKVSLDVLVHYDFQLSPQSSVSASLKFALEDGQAPLVLQETHLYPGEQSASQGGRLKASAALRLLEPQEISLRMTARQPTGQLPASSRKDQEKHPETAIWIQKVQVFANCSG